MGESVIVKLEEVYARDAKELQYSQMLGWKTISYYNYLSKSINVDFSDFDIVMNTVSNSEDEAFKSAFKGGLEGFQSFVGLIRDIKEMIGDVENKEVIEL